MTTLSPRRHHQEPGPSPGQCLLIESQELDLVFPSSVERYCKEICSQRSNDLLIRIRLKLSRIPTSAEFSLRRFCRTVLLAGPTTFLPATASWKLTPFGSRLQIKEPPWLPSKMPEIRFDFWSKALNKLPQLRHRQW